MTIWVVLKDRTSLYYYNVTDYNINNCNYLKIEYRGKDNDEQRQTFINLNEILKYTVD
jgi:hypothetical protein|nr:MAG TPA: hypothetical protein [Caudoviricetes sp.]